MWRWRRVRGWVPVGLVGLRLALAAGLVVGAVGHRGPGGAYVALLTAGLLSDIFDGVLARRWSVATPTLRRLDSFADVEFYGAALFAAWRLHPDAVLPLAPAILGLLALEAAVHLTSLLRWRVTQATHSWLAKGWGLTLWLAFAVLLGTGRSWGVPVALAVGYAADLEVMAILLLSTTAPVDVRSVAAAWQGRRANSEACAASVAH
jgi:CDP-diacylglycerol--glycerol-3-phosphate 3-phosphatidyltransferase